MYATNIFDRSINQFFILDVFRYFLRKIRTDETTNHEYGRKIPYRIYYTCFATPKKNSQFFYIRNPRYRLRAFVITRNRKPTISFLPDVNMTDDKDESTTTFMRQKLMSADECYVYKIPPLKDSGGHRYVKSLNE